MFTTFSGCASDGRVKHDAACDATLLCIKVGEQLCLAGAARLSVLRGEVSVHGFAMEGHLARPLADVRVPVVTLYSPYWESSTIVRATKCDVAVARPVAGETSVVVPPSLASHAETMFERYPDDHVVVVLWAVEGAASGADGYDVGSGSQEAALNGDVGLLGVHLLRDQATDLRISVKRVPGACVAVRRPTVLSSAWTGLGDVIARDCAAGKPTSAIVCGAKGVGKSTLCRYIVNRMLSLGTAVCPRVALLDLDLGQPECGVPAAVALHWLTAPLLGPPHTHLQPVALYDCLWTPPCSLPAPVMELCSFCQVVLSR
jgi:hypothetical protein